MQEKCIVLNYFKIWLLCYYCLFFNWKELLVVFTASLVFISSHVLIVTLAPVFCRFLPLKECLALLTQCAFHKVFEGSSIEGKHLHLFFPLSTVGKVLIWIARCVCMPRDHSALEYTRVTECKSLSWCWSHLSITDKYNSKQPWGLCAAKCYSSLLLLLKC